MAVKTQELCETCKYSFDAWCENMACSKCPQNSRKGNKCKCLTVKKGEECLMFEAGGLTNGSAQA